ncbi:phosphate ABC transporter permease subunit PstC [uncultured Sphingorhabdus sp.]|uniref:phosphate ABC transporter permease subunit PstC n=1 Tax=uncultured Sphingorhabdus sp. TaxID=1686106 RepID=UPI0026124B2C|nr:phosphate ABC transporter permease subunit PstC [uncultured Sphingorhabdus sp.]HMS21045.1 phosphate ABC transporter permease subunit PstC [Sphingorhabdus sp.]
MPISFVLISVIGLGVIAWAMSRARSAHFAPVAGKLKLALPGHYGLYAAIWTIVPALIAVWIWSLISPGLVQGAIVADPAAAQLPAFEFERNTVLNEAFALANNPNAFVSDPIAQQLAPAIAAAQTKFGWIGAVLAIVVALAGFAFGYTRIKAGFPARSKIERIVLGALLLASFVAIITTVGIIASLIFESARFFSMVNPIDFLFGTNWTPDTMASATSDMGDDLGAVPLFWGTFFIGAIIAMLVAIPFGLMSAIYLTQYASPRARSILKPMLEILAGIPTVVYGYFAALTAAPFIRDLALAVGITNASTESALAAGLVMGVMIIPFVSSMADDSIAAVPQAMRDGSLAMGATTSETIKKVLIPAALPGIVAGIMLAISRAIGETMIVYMAAGASANLSANPFERMTTVTYQIAALLTGEGSFDHPTTLSAFALGLVLFIVTLILNIVALRVVKRFREAYE